MTQISHKLQLALTRRKVLRGLGGAVLSGATIAAPYVARGQGALKPITVSVGRIPWAAFNSPMSQYMINNKLFEKHAASLGYDVTIENNGLMGKSFYYICPGKSLVSPINRIHGPQNQSNFSLILSCFL